MNPPLDSDGCESARIRAILRKERPKKYRLAIIQLQQLCDECKEKGVEAELIIEGELSKVPEKYLEIILQIDEEFEVIGCAVNGKEAIELAKKEAPDVFLMYCQGSRPGSVQQGNIRKTIYQ